MYKNRIANKGEGPVGTWKAGLSRELRNLEDNLDQMYTLAGLQTQRIVGNDNQTNALPHASTQDSNFEAIINDLTVQIDASVRNICSMINANTEYDLPIPIYILLRVATKLGSLRCKDYQKKPTSMLVNYIYNMTPYLIQDNMMLFKSLVHILGTNIIPFGAVINQTIFRILEWTRTSNLMSANEIHYHAIRIQQFKMLTYIIDQISLNINIEPSHLKTLLEEEFVDNLQKLASQETEHPDHLDEHMFEALCCLQRILVIYNDLLDSKLEFKVKNYVVQTCIKTYRDFEANTIDARCRGQLLKVLETIANQPFATSTSEISYHIFELAERIETHQDIKSIATTALRVGLAHRPTIVTHYDVLSAPFVGNSELLAETAALTNGHTEEAQSEKVDEETSIVEEQLNENSSPDVEMSNHLSQTGEAQEPEVIQIIESDTEINGDNLNPQSTQVEEIALDPLDTILEQAAISNQDNDLLSSLGFKDVPASNLDIE